MTLITLQDGKIVLRDGKVGTEQACCCGGCCIVDGNIEFGYATQQECEQCDVTRTCEEYSEPTPEGCPDGYDNDGFGECVRYRTVADCSECDGYCSEDAEGPCGTWKANCPCSGPGYEVILFGPDGCFWEVCANDLMDLCAAAGYTDLKYTPGTQSTNCPGEFFGGVITGACCGDPLTSPPPECGSAVGFARCLFACGPNNDGVSPDDPCATDLKNTQYSDFFYSVPNCCGVVPPP
jgi:hypothetical protein